MDFSHRRVALSLCHCIYLVLVEVSQLTSYDTAKALVVTEVSYSNTPCTPFHLIHLMLNGVREQTKGEGD